MVQIQEKLKQIAKLIQSSEHLVVFTGAGISTASGLPDYRGPDGVWTRRDKGLEPPILNKPLKQIEPNIAHKVLVEFQKMGLLKFLISQNVDGLHLKSGIDLDKIAELHGNSFLWKCISCDRRYKADEVGWDRRKFGNGYRTENEKEGQPLCPKCNCRIISSVINFEDPMPELELNQAELHSARSDVFIVIGSTLLVTPAADYPIIAKKNGAKIIIINLGSTGLDQIADIRVEGDCTEILPEILKLVNDMKN